MKILIFSGTHSRHVFIHETICKYFDVCGAVVMEREPTMPGKTIKGTSNSIIEWPLKEQELYKLHFKKRDIIEKKYYKNKTTKIYNSYCDTLNVTPSELNSQKVKDFILSKKPDVCFIFGVNLIKENIMNIMPKLSINLHLGLSPWYRGSATLFWPFYNLQPQFAGSTFHQIVNEPDAGDILHQTVPVLKQGDTLHEVAAKVVIQSAVDAVKLLKIIEKNKKIKLQKQKNSGKNYLIKDFEPHHLNVIYNLFNDNVVDEYLKGNLGNKTPKLIKAF